MIIKMSAMVKRVFGSKNVNLSLETVSKDLAKYCPDAKVEEDAVCFTAGNRSNRLLISADGKCRVERRYDVPDAALVSLQWAAGKTMTEVFSAKVRIEKNREGDLQMFFFVDLTYRSSKDLMKKLGDYLEILDSAEDRQRVNLADCPQPQISLRRPIGFNVSYGETA